MVLQGREYHLLQIHDAYKRNGLFFFDVHNKQKMVIKIQHAPICNVKF